MDWWIQLQFMGKRNGRNNQENWLLERFIDGQQNDAYYLLNLARTIQPELKPVFSFQELIISFQYNLVGLIDKGRQV